MRKLIFCLLFLIANTISAQLPKSLVYVQEEIPSIQLELRYYTNNNFVGKRIKGYQKPVCILTKQATQALKKVQEELKTYNLSLKIYDAYRPQQAVDYFRLWARNLNDTINKQQFYPDVDKRDLFKLEYIATRSRHSSGSTIDVTLVDLLTRVELDMGTPYDFFGKESWIHYNGITTQQKANRMLLQTIMNKYGFRPYPQEWWHFTLRGEPFRNQYFNFPVE